MAKILISAI